MTEEEKKKKRQQTRQASAKARAQQQDAPAVEQTVANVEQEKPKEPLTQDEMRLKQGKKLPSEVKRPGQAVKVETIEETRTPERAAEYQKQANLVAEKEQAKEDAGWNELVSNAHKNAGTKLSKVTVDPMFKGTSYAETIEKQVKAGNLSPGGNNQPKFAKFEQTIDPAKISSVRDLAYITASVTDEKDKKKLVDMYAERHKMDKQDLYYQVEIMTEGRVFGTPLSARGKAEQIGLYDIYDNKVDYSKATPAQFIQAIELTLDADDQKALISAFKTAYPEYYSKDMKFDYIDDARMTQTMYDDQIDAWATEFTLGDDAGNAEKFTTLLADVNEAYGDSPRLLAQMTRGLEKVYGKRTGKNAPPADVLNQYVADEQNGTKTHEDVLGLFDEQTKYVPNVTLEPEEETEVEEASAASGGTGGGTYWGGSWASNYTAPSGKVVGRNPSEEANEAAMEAAAQAAAEESGGAEPAVVVRGEEAAQTYGESIAYNPEMTDLEAFSAIQMGYAIDDRNRQQVSWVYEDPDVLALTGNMSMYANLGKTQEGGRNVVSKTTYYGNELGMAAMQLGAGGIPDDIANSAVLTLGKVVYDINNDIKSGRLAIPQTDANGRPVNQFDYALSLPQYADQAAAVASVMHLRADVDDAYDTQRQLDAQAREERLEYITQQTLLGKGTPEMAQELVVAYGNKDTDYYDDETFIEYKHSLNEYGNFFSDGGTFWQGDSHAAQTGRTLRAAGRGYADYKSTLKNEIVSVLEEYTAAASQLDMTLGEYLEASNLKRGIYDIIDIADANLIARGNAYANDPEAQATAAEMMEMKPQGILGASGTGAKLGFTSTGASLMQTAYMAIDAADYQTAVIDLENDYREKYGDLAPYIYRSDLNAYIASNTMSEEATTELKRNMSEVRNIFDLGFELDPGFLEGLSRNVYNDLQKTSEALEDEIAKMPAAERAVASMISSGTSSLGLMAASAAVGGLTGSALLANALVYGGSEFSNAYDANRDAGMPRGIAALASFGNAAIATAVNMGGTGTDMDVLFGGTLYDDFAKTLSGKNGLDMMKGLWGLAKKYMWKRGAEEAVEEGAETLYGGLYDTLDGAWKILSTGRPVKLSELLGSVGDAISETDYAEASKELFMSMGMGFVVGGMFSLGGTTKTFINVKHGANMQAKYPSLALSAQIAQGNVPLNEENIGKVFLSLQEDMKDPVFRKFIDKNSAAALDNRAMLAAAVSGAGNESRKLAVDHANKAREYGEKAKAAAQASEVAQGRFFELRDRVSGGDLSAQAAFESARMQWQKAQTTQQETENAAAKESERAREFMSAWLLECKRSSIEVKLDMIKEQADKMKAERDALAAQLQAQYDAEHAELSEIERQAMESNEEGVPADTASLEESRDFTFVNSSGQETTLEGASISKPTNNKTVRKFTAQYRFLTDAQLTDRYNELMATAFAPHRTAPTAAEKAERGVLEWLLTHPQDRYGSPTPSSKRAERVTDIATGTTKEQREAVKAEQTEQKNLDEMDADAFVEENYPNASEEEKQRYRERYLARVASAAEQNSEPSEETVVADEPIGKGAELAVRAAHKFGFNVKFYDKDTQGLKGIEGGYLAKKNTIYLRKDVTQSEVIKRVLLHEMTHFSEAGKSAYTELRNALFDLHYGKDTERLKADIASTIKTYNATNKANGRTGTMSQEQAKQEITARLCSELLSGNPEMVERLVAEKPSVARRVVEAIRNFLAQMVGVEGPEIARLRKVEKQFEKALERAQVEKAQTNESYMPSGEHPESMQLSIAQLADATGLKLKTTPEDKIPYELVDANGKKVTSITPEMVKSTPAGSLVQSALDAGTIDETVASAQLKMFSDLATMAAEYKDQAMVWELAGAQVFSAIKNNSDKQYSSTVDFGTICAKTQAIVDVMSDTMLRLKRGLSREEVLDVYHATTGADLSVPCPVCYVFSRWMGVPSLLNNMSEYQKRFSGMAAEEVTKYADGVYAKYAAGSDNASKAIGKAKTKLEGQLETIARDMQRAAARGESIDALNEKAKKLEAEYADVEAYNWVTQVLCKQKKQGTKTIQLRDANGNLVLNDKYRPVPEEILFDLRRTGEFAEYESSWKYRTTRGAGMGKAILPYSGASLGDTVSGKQKRWATGENPFMQQNTKAGARAIKNAQKRMARQNLIGGQRFQSTSDYRPEWGLDYMMTFLEMQAVGAKGQLYTKVIEAVDMFATAGIEVNLSIMPKGDGYHYDKNGNPALDVDDFSSVTGIDFAQALEKTQKYDNVQMILVGINDTHIKLALADDRIGFVIPWHASGNSKDVLSELVGAVGERLNSSEDYTTTQSDGDVENPTKEQKAAASVRERLLTGKLRKGMTEADRRVIEDNPYLKELYRRFYEDKSETETYGVFLSSSQASQIFPYEYWDTSLTRDQADENGRRFAEYCESIGKTPRFPQFRNDPGYWKLLIDRSMYNNDGTYHHPQKIDATNVSIGDVAESVSVAKYGDREKTVAAADAAIERIRSKLPAEDFDDMQFSAEDFSEEIEPSELTRYNNIEWIGKNNVLTRSELQNVESGIRKYSNKTATWSRNKDGMLIIHTWDKNNDLGIIAIAGKDPVDVRIDRVYRLNLREDPYFAKEAEETILENEQRFGYDAQEFVEPYVRIGAVEIHSSQDYPPDQFYGNGGGDGSGRGDGDRTSERMPDGGGSSDEAGRAGDVTGALDGLQASVDDATLDAEIDAWRAARRADIDAANQNDGVSQFAERTVQRAAVPVQVKQEFRNNPLLRNYAKDTNADQMNRAMQNIETNGYESEVNRLLDADTFSAEDTVEAGAIAISAFEAGDISTGLEMALKYRVVGTEQAQAFQSRKLFAGMTPTHIKLKVAGEAEQTLTDYIASHRGAAQKVNERAKKADDAIRGKQGGSELERLNQQGNVTIDSSNANRWGVLLNEKQKALIDHYKLNKVERPGIYYNRANTKQRMLEAILMTPDPDADSGNGLTLTQRLEWMQEGQAVVTQADLNYITNQIAQYSTMSETEQAGRAGDLALARAFEAYGNINPASTLEKARTWRYVSMLLSLPSAERNIIGNAVMNAVNSAAHDTVGVFVDWVTSKVTGERTTALLSMKERADGWYAWREETGNTIRDYFVDRADATPSAQGDDRFNRNQRGRVYESAVPEGMRVVEGFLMSVGDRNFWKKAYVNSLAEQQRVADMNGVELDYNEACEIAKAEADYATFNEDGFIRNWLSSARQNPVAGFVLDMIMPFTGVPTNITKRMIEYSPLGLATTFVKQGIRAHSGANFNQKEFVNDLSRAISGSLLFVLGMGLKELGVIKLGTGGEDDERVYNLKSSMGEQFSPFIQIGGENVSLSTFAPSVSPIIMGATAFDILKDDDDKLKAFQNAAVAAVDQIFDASYMSGLSDLFDSNGSFAENALNTVVTNAISQNVPAFMTQIATAMDPYVRDTKDANAITQAVKNGLINRIPGVREQYLNEKTDITGKPFNSKEGARNFFDPFTTTKVNDDAAMTELDRLYDELGTSTHIPSYLVKTSGKVTILSTIADDRKVKMDRSKGEQNLVLTASERNHYNRLYSTLAFEGTGDTRYKGVGKVDTRFKGIRETMESRAYQRASDEEKAEMISDILKQAKLLTQAQMVIDKGYTR